MFKIKRIVITKIVIAFSILMLVVNCTKDQNTFLPYKKVYLPIPLATYNHLKIPGNSILFKNHGFKGVIVVCVNPELNQYYAYDACCPYEKDFSGTLITEPVPGLQTPPGTVFSSAFFGICNKCGSEFNLMASGQPVKGPAIHYLQNYNIITSFEYLTVSN